MQIEMENGTSHTCIYMWLSTPHSVILNPPPPNDKHSPIDIMVLLGLRA